MMGKNLNGGKRSGLSRRTFLKGSAGAAAGTAVLAGSAASGERVLRALGTSPAPALQQEVKTFTIACPGMGCHQSCPLQAEVVNGRIARVMAAPIPGAPEDTHACLRGLASYQLPYLPERLKYPMKRVGERGEGEWERISWDEAYDTIATKLKEIRDEYGPEAVLMRGSGSSSVPGSGVNAGASTGRFSNLFGCTEIIGWTIDGGLFCAGLVNYGYFFGGGNDPRDWVNSKLLIIWGENMAETAMRDFKHVLEAQASGTRVIVIGSLFDPTAAKADWWIPVEPATDGALALSMLHVLLEDNLYDPDYVAKYTVGPFLVRDDNGQFLMESEIAPNGSPENYVVWDEASDKAVAVPPHVSEIPGVRVAITGAYIVEDIPCHTAFQLLADRAAEYPPERAAEICQVPPDVIRKLSATYGTSKPAAIKIGFGLTRTFHGDLNARAILALGAVTGNVGIHGGGASGLASGYSPLLNTDAVIAADDRRARRIHVSTGHAGAVTGEPYPIKAWLVFGNNPLNTMPNPNVWFEKILPGLSFIVVTDIVESWTARYADILLPGTTIYERSDIYTALGCAIRSQQAIAPLYETKSDIEICSELAKRLGFGEHFTNSTDEYIEIMLDHPSLEGITLAELNQNGGIVRAKEPPEPMVSFADKKFPSRSGRIQLYADYLKDIGEELPLHKESPEISSPAASRYPLRFYTGRRRFWTQSMSYYPLARELSPEPRLRINSIDARKHGIRSGDRVRVFNDRGSFVLKAKVSEVVRPGSIWVEHGWGPQDFEQGHYQNLLLPLNLPDESMINPAFQIFWGMFQKFVETTPSPGLAPYGLADQLFDCLVEVEKI